MEIVEVIELINKKSDRVTLERNSNGTSQVWDKCRLVKMDGQSVNFVQC